MENRESERCEICGSRLEGSTTEQPAVCPVCGDFEEKARLRWENLIRTYNLKHASLSPDRQTLASFQRAVECVEEYFGTTIKYRDYEFAWETAEWWYLPAGWIGCRGFIVDKADGHVNALGSCHSLDDCFWGHNKGFKYPSIDLTITRVNDLEATFKFLDKLGNRSPYNPIGNKPPVFAQPRQWYTRQEVLERLGTLPCCFPNLFLWYNIPDFRAIESRPPFDYRIERSKATA